MTYVNILGGSYNIRGKATDVSNVVFRMLKPYREGARGGYVTVDGREAPGFPDRDIRIACERPEHCVATDGTPVMLPATYPGADSYDAPVMPEREPETDEEIDARISLRFEMLDEMTSAARKGLVKAMIVTGAPGVGKSHGVETVLGKGNTLAQMMDEDEVPYEVIKGVMSALHLYMKLYEFSGDNQILVFDDCDTVFYDDASLNILKAALDSKAQRNISWNTESKVLDAAGIPNSFEFKGAVIFITNINFANVRSAKLRQHLEAIESRCHYMDLTIDTMRERIIRIKQVIQNNMLSGYELEQDVKNEIVQFVDENQDKLRELSLRTVLKIADLAIAFPHRWQDYAKTTTFKTR